MQAPLTQSWRLDDPRQSLVLAARRNRLPEIVYWGARLPDGEGDTGTALMGTKIYAELFPQVAQ